MTSWLLDAPVVTLGGGLLVVRLINGLAVVVVEVEGIL